MKPPHGFVANPPQRRGLIRWSAVLIAFCLGVFLRTASAVDTTWVLNGDGSWTEPANWSNGVPASTGFDAFIDDGDSAVNVTYDGVGLSIGELTLGADDTLGFAPSTSLTVTGVNSVLDGTVQVPSTTFLEFDGSGAPGGRSNLEIGSLALGALDVSVVEASGGTLRMQDVDVTIGQGGAGGDLFASNGGRIELESVTVDLQAGIFFADAFGTLAFTGGVSEPGPLQVGVNGRLEIAEGATVRARSVVLNNGEVVMCGCPSGPMPARLEVPDDASSLSLTGVGTLNMSQTESGGVFLGSQTPGGTIINTAGHTILGAGVIGDDSANVVNDGVIRATEFGDFGPVVIRPFSTATGAGDFEAIDAGTKIQFDGGVHTYTGAFSGDGTVEVLVGTDFTLGGGTYTVANTIVGGLARLDDVEINLTTGEIINVTQGDLWVRGAGVVDVDGGALIVDAPSGGPGFRLFDQATLRINNGSVTVEKNGGLSPAGAAITVNDGAAIELLGGQLDLDAVIRLAQPEVATDTGQFIQDGGSLNVLNTLSYLGGGTYVYRGGSITGVPLLRETNLSIETNSPAEFEFIAFAGDGPAQLDVQSGVLAAGQVVDVSSRSEAAEVTAEPFANDGVVRVVGGLGGGGRPSLTVDTLTNNAGGLVELRGGEFDGDLINNGTLTVLASPTSTVFEKAAGVTTNNSQFTVHAGATLTIAAGGLVSHAAGDLDVDGVFGLEDGSNLNLDGGDLDLDGDVVISGGGRLRQDGGRLVYRSGVVDGRHEYVSGQITTDGGASFEVGAGTLELIGSLDLGPGVPFAVTGGEVKIRSGQTLTAPAGATLAEVGRISGEGTLQADLFAKEGVIAPGNSPGILTIDGDLTQTPSSALEIEIQGVGTPGVDFDQVIVTGAAALDGRLEVPILSPFTPTAGTGVTFLTAAGGVTGAFDAVVSDGLPAGVAISIDDSMATERRIEFIATDDTNLFDSTLASTDWDDAAATWSLGVTPESFNELVVNNLISGPQEVVVSASDEQVHEITVSGDSAVETMTVSVIGDTTLAATTDFTVGAFGVVEVGTSATTAPGGSVAANTIVLESGATVQGNGVFEVGTEFVIRSGAVLTPGFSVGAVRVEGNYEQQSGGVLEVEVMADETSDTLTITGEADLGGELMVDAADLTAADAGDTIEFLTSDGGVKAGTTFDEVMTGNSTEVYVSPIYGASSVSLQVNLVGDMNGDGAIDPADVGAFALGLSNPLAFFLQYFVSPDSAGGNLDDNGRLDFDDIDEFAALIEGVSSAMVVDAVAAALEAPVVPEPSAVVLLFLGTCSWRRRA